MWVWPLFVVHHCICMFLFLLLPYLLQPLDVTQKQNATSLNVKFRDTTDSKEQLVLVLSFEDEVITEANCWMLVDTWAEQWSQSHLKYWSSGIKKRSCSAEPDCKSVAQMEAYGSCPWPHIIGLPFPTVTRWSTTLMLLDDTLIRMTALSCYIGIIYSPWSCQTFPVFQQEGVRVMNLIQWWVLTSALLPVNCTHKIALH